ncbi:PEP-CTERM sorting domain-containing protein [Roseibacillus persicicus]|uniref:PEP-CTERM sorting domain-containing protein n=1 Tax=Roseibacillus persicicus TaxID=454148 RepID=UPI00280FD9CB|nr:PEP-CTERM sorting domain-containing protein [Roseibacillus persicicus]MDQ8191401.1 hypothetical protein [Roseibacillus persicicus]
MKYQKVTEKASWPFPLVSIAVILSLSSTSLESAVVYSTASASAYTALDLTPPPNSSDGSGDVYILPDFSSSEMFLSDVPFSGSTVLLDTTVYSSPSPTDFVGLGLSPSTTSLTVLNGETGANGATINSSDNYVGFSMTGDPDQNASPIYGWLQFQLGSAFSDSSQAVIIAFAYEDSGQPISLGGTNTVPEPSSVFLAVAGSLLLCANRRRRA